MGDMENGRQWENAPSSVEEENKPFRESVTTQGLKMAVQTALQLDLQKRNESVIHTHVRVSKGISNLIFCNKHNLSIALC